MRMLYAAAAAAVMTVAAPAYATDFSFSGFFTQDDDLAVFDFVAAGESFVTLRSYSYAGGTNVAGISYEAGGFDPILSIYNLTTGASVAFQDDGEGIPSDPVTGAFYDVNFVAALAAGSYRVILSQYDNFGGATLSDPFRRDDGGNFTRNLCDSGNDAPFCDFTGAKRTGNWAFDILGVDSAVGPEPGAVPEPATWAMMILGFGLIGAAMRRRPTVRISYAG